MKKLLTVCLCICLMFSGTVVLAQQPTPTVNLKVSEPDSNGMIVVSMVVQNAKFQVFQGTIRFNPAEAQLTDDEIDNIKVGTPLDGQPMKGKLFTEVKCSVDNEKGLFTYVVMTNTGQKAPSEYIDEKYGVIANESGIEIFSVRLKKTGEGDADIAFAKKSDGVFDQINPEGAALAYNGDPLKLTAVLKTPEKETEHEIVPVIPEPEKTAEQLREERIEGSIILQISNYAAVKEGTLSRIDANNKKVVPYIENSRTMVPLRFIAECLGLLVEWDGETKEIVMTSEDTNLVMQIDNTSYDKNGETFTMESAPVLTADDRTFVPLRVIAEAFGQSVHWIEKDRCVIIVPKEKPWDEANATERRLLQDALLIMSPLIRDMN